jgi:hypothetical protein
MNITFAQDENIIMSDGIIVIGLDLKKLRHMKDLCKHNNKPIFHLTKKDVDNIFNSKDRHDEKFSKLKTEFIIWLITNKIKNLFITGDIFNDDNLRKKNYIILIKLLGKNFPEDERMNKRYNIIRNMLYETTENKIKK